jgi:hypothetical protein
MSKVKALLCAISMVPFAVGAQNLIKNGNAEANLENWVPESLQLITENPHSGKNSFVTKITRVVGTALIPVDGSKTYKYSGWFKSADDKKTLVLFGFSPLDADKKSITAAQVNVMADTETALAAECNPEDSVIRIKDGSKWNIKDEHSHIVFNVDDSGGYKDLPNTNIVAPVIVKIEKKSDIWEVTLKEPCGVAFDAGAKIRVHKDGGYMYAVTLPNFQSKDWTGISADIKGTAKSGCGGEQFWPGTKYVKIVILALNGGMIYFDDIQLEEAK